MFTAKRKSVLLLAFLFIGASLILSRTAEAATKTGDIGWYGNNVTYSLADDGVLTISGEGKMEDSSSYSGLYYKKDLIKEVIIEEGVTYIGKYTFSYLKELTKATLPSSIKTIGEGAFDQCFSLKYINFPEGLEKIEAFAFNATDLQSLEIPSTLSELGSYALSTSSILASITVASGNKTFDSRNNCNALIETENNKLILASASTTIPPTVTSIGESAFGGITSLKITTIPSTIKSLSRGAFGGTGITNITVPGSIWGIPAHAFSSDNLQSVTLLEGVTSLDNEAFGDCENLKSITLPVSLKEIHELAFLRTNNIQDVYYAGSEAQWEKIEIWYNNSVHPLESYRKTIGTLKQETELSELSPLFKATIHFKTTNTAGSGSGGSADKKNGETAASDQGKKENPITVKAAVKTVKASALKKKDQTIKKALIVKKAKGAVTYKKVKKGTTNKIYKKIKVDKKTGTITLKKGVKKGTYKIRIKVTAAGTASFAEGSKTVTVKVKVK